VRRKVKQEVPAMLLPPAVIIHGLPDARAALRPGRPVTLLSAHGAAAYAGVLWWRELIAAARAAHPATQVHDVLDCGDAPGHAMAALRVGQRLLVLNGACPAFAAVAAAAARLGAHVLPAPPPALDLAERGARQRLPRWLGG
jgi:acyl-CoA synthetase (AMP-forming)/AMP-acid ligase II